MKRREARHRFHLLIGRRPRAGGLATRSGRNPTRQLVQCSNKLGRATPRLPEAGRLDGESGDGDGVAVQ